MPTSITANKKPAAATIRDRLNLVFSTTPPPRKEQVDVSYHAHDARSKPR